MSARRPSTVTAVLLAVLLVAGALGILAPVATRAGASAPQTVPVAAELSTVDTAERAAAAQRADRSQRTQRPGRTAREARAERRMASAMAMADPTPRGFGVAVVTAQVERYERRQARIQAAREAARRARERQQWLDRWVMPIHSYTWSAGFGEAGSMWSSGYHTGQDWTTSYGTPVYAAARGTISFAGWSDAYGNKLVITHYDGSQSWYAHLDAFERTGGTVKAGELVGYVGCTGNCYGPHLHYEVHLADGSDTDPVDWLRRHGVGL